MSILKLTLPPNTKVCNGKLLTFSAPCDCLGVTHIQIEGTNYQLVDARGLSTSDRNLFVKDAMITVTLDTINSKAYLQGGGGGGGSFSVGTTAPTDTSALWIDTTANTGGLKYYNGTSWVPVPVSYT